MIIVVGGEKGGTGKTTLATTLAALRAADGRDVLLVDTDKQRTASFWATVRGEASDGGRGAPARVRHVQMLGKGITREVPDLAERYDDVVVDAGGRDSIELRAAALVADRLFVPIRPTQFDSWTLEHVNNLVEEAQTFNPRLRAYVVLNLASTHPRVREAEEAAEYVGEFEHLELADVCLRDRIAFSRAAASGLAVTEVEEPDRKAVAEARAWYELAFAE